MGKFSEHEYAFYMAIFYAICMPTAGSLRGGKRWKCQEVDLLKVETPVGQLAKGNPLLVEL